MSQPPDTPPPSFVPQLDARQRAMLAEMGVRVWAPKAAASAPQQQPEPAPPQASAPATPAPTPPPAAAPVAPPPPTAVPLMRPAHAGEIQAMDWPTLRETVAGCQACGLCKSRKNTVFGVGDEQADWMIVGEAPGQNEDLQGEPFVGAAGQLLDLMLGAVGRSRTGQGPQGGGTYIANVLKCRPPANRNPQPEEVAQCEPYLVRQVALVRPRIIIAMGRFAVQSLLKTTDPIGRLRGRVHRYQGVPVIVSYHPAYLLRTPADKSKAWADLCLALHTLEQG